MQVVRQIDWESALSPTEGCKAQLLYAGESCSIAAMKVPPGAHALARHTHPHDQVYLVVAGTTTVELGDEERRVGRYGTAFIPAGVPHHSRNDGDVDEIHLEVIAPGIFFKPAAIPTDSREAGDGKYWTRNLAGDELPDADARSFSAQWMVSRELGSEHVTAYLAELEPGSAGPATHVHEFDQFYFVLEGTLQVTVGLAEHSVGPNSLVVIPAGVPHSQRNASDVIERHIALLAPEPVTPHSADRPWDVPVTFARS